MNKSKDETGEHTNFSRIIKKLETLEEHAQYYQEHFPYGETDHRGLNTGADKYWSQNVQPLVEDINRDLENIWSGLADYTEQGDNFGGYSVPVGTPEQNLRKDVNFVINKSRKPDEIHALTQHIKIIQQRIKVKSGLSGESQPQGNAEQVNMHTLLDEFSSYAKDVKSSADLYEAMNKVGPFPRSHKRKILDGKVEKIIEETEPAEKEAREVCEHARRIAIQLRESDRNIKRPLPKPERDPYMDWQRIMEWCLDAEAQRHKQEEIKDSNVGYINKNYIPFGYGGKKAVKWQFVFNGNEAIVDGNLKGLVLVEFLLLHKNDEYKPLELLKAVELREENETESEKIYSPKDIEKIKTEIKGLKGRVEESLDLEEKSRLEEQIEQAEKQLRKSRNYKGNSRKFSDKYRLSVIRLIDNVLKQISPQHTELYNHLERFLKRGEICSYMPDTEISWEII